MEAAISAPGAGTTVKLNMQRAKFCLMMSHLERCYAEEIKHKDQEDVLALEIYRTLADNKQILKAGCLKAVTMAYEDMFRVIEGPAGRTLHCMHRVPNFRFNRSLNLQYLKQFKSSAPHGGWDQYELVLRLAHRASYFQTLISANQGKPKGSLDGLEVTPLEAGIHLETDTAN